MEDSKSSSYEYRGFRIVDSNDWYAFNSKTSLHATNDSELESRIDEWIKKHS